KLNHRLWPPVLAILLSVPVLIYRGTRRDWHWSRPVSGSSASTPGRELPKASQPAPAVAAAPEGRSGVTKAAPVPATAALPKVERQPEAKDAWEDIRREAERKKAEIAELEKV